MDRKRSKPSGAQFRKKRKEEEEEKRAKDKGALLKYFGASSATGQDEPPTSPATQVSSGMVSTLQDELPSMSSATHMSPQISDIEDEDLFASTSPQHEPSEMPGAEPPLSPTAEDEPLSTDPANWPSHLTDRIWTELVRRGPSKVPPGFVFCRNDSDVRSCLHQYFKNILTENKILNDFHWLIYSMKNNSLFCFCCKLFSKRNINLTSAGMANWKHASDYLTSHENRDTETLFTPSNGNFLKEVELMARFDPIMNDHLNHVERGTASHHSYLGYHVQNELIDLLSSKIISALVDDIKQAKFFSVILDCTPDISHTEQLSVVIGVVSLMEKPHIREHFIGFLEAEESTGQHLASMILTRLEELGIPFEDCRGQSYDNGANCLSSVCAMWGAYNEFSCFGVVQKLYTLFSASSQRWAILKNHVSITLKMWAETRWESKVKSVEPMRYQGAAVREASIEVRDNTKDPAIKAEAQSLSEEVGSYRFSICTVVWCDMISAIQHVSKLMQSPNMHVDLAVSLLNKTERDLQSYKASVFVTAQMAAKDICEDMNVDARHFSYESHDEPFSDAFRKLEVGFFNVVVDAATSAIKERFSTLENVGKKFGLAEQCEALGTTLHFKGHSDLGSRELVQEIKNFPNLPSKTMSLLGLITFMHDKDLSEIYPNFWTALRIALTLPVTVAQAERSFSKLKLIKSYLRSTMSQERLTGLAIISINHSIGEQMSYDDIIDDFASRKIRKVRF
ncbi:transposase [Triplophysa rosa]|uniref:Transposase n=1 Tax=Triplophysa rosa TaxID=992332 RepID=A0A9W7WGM9_TRIRA|nr:transposase [Triplophysa rosa]